MTRCATLFALGVIGFWTSGCATSKSTVESRRAERAAEYAALSDEQRALVDQGYIKAGMSEAAVYIAWGPPAQVLRAGDAAGETVTWLYHGQTTDTFLYWRFHPVVRPDGSTYLTRNLERDLSVREYVSAELTFRNGRLESWRALPRPPGGTFYNPR
jgi:hypothetical protein